MWIPKKFIEPKEAGDLAKDLLAMFKKAGVEESDSPKTNPSGGKGSENSLQVRPLRRSEMAIKIQIASILRNESFERPLEDHSPVTKEFNEFMEKFMPQEAKN